MAHIADRDLAKSFRRLCSVGTAGGQLRAVGGAGGVGSGRSALQPPAHSAQAKVYAAAFSPCGDGSESGEEPALSDDSSSGDDENRVPTGSQGRWTSRGGDTPASLPERGQARPGVTSAAGRLAVLLAGPSPSVDPAECDQRAAAATAAGFSYNRARQGYEVRPLARARSSRGRVIACRCLIGQPPHCPPTSLPAPPPRPTTTSSATVVSAYPTIYSHGCTRTSGRASAGCGACCVASAA
jgi:hypothetical protein